MKLTLLYFSKDDAGAYVEREKIEANSYEEAERIGREKFGDDFIEVEEKAQEERRKQLKKSRYYR